MRTPTPRPGPETDEAVGAPPTTAAIGDAPTAPAGAEADPDGDFPSGALDAEGRVAGPRPCRRCGFLLTGLRVLRPGTAPAEGDVRRSSPVDRRAACPECGLPIVRSLTADLLVHAEPDWLATIHRGLRLAILGIVAGIVFGWLFAAVAAIGGYLAAQGGGGAIARSILAAGTVGGLGIQFLTLVGLWWLTAPEAARTASERPLSARRITRWCSLALLVAAPGSLLLTSNGALIPTGAAMPVPGSAIAIGVVLMIGQLLVLAGRVAGCWWLAELNARIPRPRRVRRLRIAGVGVGASYGVVIVAGTVLGLVLPALGAGATAYRTVMVGGVGLTVLASIVMLGCAIVGLVLAVRTSFDLRRIIAEARALDADPSTAA